MESKAPNIYHLTIDPDGRFKRAIDTDILRISSAVDQEIKRAAMPFVGERVTRGMQEALQMQIASVLNRMVTTGVITQYEVPTTVRRNDHTIEVNYTIRPTVTNNRIETSLVIQGAQV